MGVRGSDIYNKFASPDQVCRYILSSNVPYTNLVDILLSEYDQHYYDLHDFRSIIKSLYQETKEALNKSEVYQNMDDPDGYFSDV